MQPITATPPALQRAAEPSLPLLRYAWNLVMSKLGVFVMLSALAVVAAIATHGMSFILTSVLGIHGHGSSPAVNHVMAELISAVLAAFVGAPISAGLYGVIYKLIQGDPDYIKGFSAFSTRYLSVVAVQMVFSVIAILGTFLASTFIAPVFSGFVSSALTLIIGFFGALAIPSVVAFGWGPTDAIAYSARRFLSRPVSYGAYYVVAGLMSVIGIIACGVGILLTMAVGSVAYALLLVTPAGPPQGVPGVYPRYPEQPTY